MQKNIVVLIPAFNPTPDLIDLSNKLINSNYTVLVVNDGSNDKSQDIFKKLHKNIIILNHSKNLGKGSALKTGFKYIKDNINCIGIISADADGQHLFDDIENIANQLLGNSDSLILGSRIDNKKTPLRSKFRKQLNKNHF